VVMPGEAAERRALALAARQHGAATTRQLAEAGLGRHRVAHRAAIGWLVRVHRGVFLVGPIHAPLGRAMAAVLSCGEGALLSHHTAGRLWGFLRDAAGAIHVTVPRRGGVHNGRGIRLHRTQALEPADVTYRERIPVTSPARTLLDLATVLPRAELARAVEEAMVQRLVTPASVTEQFGRYPRHRGVDALREAVRPESSLTRSEAERRLLELIRSARLHEPRTNAQVGRYEVDLLWPEVRLVVEVDGYAFHATRGAFERDRRRDADLQAGGYRVLRLTWTQIADEPEAVLASLALAYGQRTRGAM
jgi:very-short-patch-repair endonuclease